VVARRRHPRHAGVGRPRPDVSAANAAVFEAIGDHLASLIG
jgi:hypothetical protein